MSIRVKKSTLLHICCAPCSTHVIKKLQADFSVTGYFYNPNLYPESEHNKRRQEAIRFGEEIGIEMLVPDKYEKKEWLELVKGLEKEPEGGQRCEICYRMRLEKTARLAAAKKYDYFAATLTISPHKRAEAINKIGADASQQHGVKFYAADFKKEGGFQESVELSEKHKLYRQNYCGCEFSK
ncbi:MAG: epoxyqueuosine reductase QueH [Parcubacteria group bacterium]|nr:epoxyqueuosine reductase QueH [Parcubacteria group bacterium]